MSSFMHFPICTTYCTLSHFTEQTSRDGEKWYKVYATTRAEKTPTVQDERGRMQYDERKVATMPKAPARRH